MEVISGAVERRIRQPKTFILVVVEMQRRSFTWYSTGWQEA